MTPEETIDRYVAMHGPYGWEMREIVQELARIKVDVVLEIGCWQGDSLRIWRALWPQARLIGIEPTDELAPVVSEIDVEWHQGESQNLTVHNNVVALLAGKPVDFLYIDGDHHYEPARRDFELYEPLVRPGGIIVLHDAVITWNPTVEVYKLYTEIRNGRRTKLIYDGLDPADPYGGATGAAIVFK